MIYQNESMLPKIEVAVLLIKNVIESGISADYDTIGWLRRPVLSKRCLVIYAGKVELL